MGGSTFNRICYLAKINEQHLKGDMIEKEITKAQFDKIVELAYPTPKDETKKASMTKHNSKVELLQSIYVGDFNNTISGTAWGAYNALTERQDWYRNGRKGSNEAIKCCFWL